MSGRSYPHLPWPPELSHTATRDRWYERFAALEPGLSLAEAAKALKQSYATIYRWAETFNYDFPDLRRRGRVSLEEWSAVDWTQRDADISRELGVSRERVRQVRAARGIGPSAHRAQVERFTRWARAHRDQLHGTPVADVLSDFAKKNDADTLSVQVARRLLRAAGVDPHDPGSHWRDADWRLSNADLADIWNTAPRHVANLRTRLKAGAAQWDGAAAGHRRNAQYKKALAAEQKRAKSHAI